jgi:hypothetical protein
MKPLTSEPEAHHSTAEQEAVATWPLRQTPLKSDLGPFA